MSQHFKAQLQEKCKLFRKTYGESNVYISQTKRTHRVQLYVQYWSVKKLVYYFVAALSIHSILIITGNAFVQCSMDYDFFLT
jgi:hypothetical protein